MIDHLEKNSSLHADYIVSPSRYLLDWALERGYVQSKTPAAVIPNVCSSIVELTSKTVADKRFFPKEIIFVGRHESRKGLDLFVRAITKNTELLRSLGVQVTILGSFGTVNETPSGIYLLNELGPTDITLSFKIDFDRFDVVNYLRHSKDALVVIPSPEENSPYSVLEPLMLKVPVITSSKGGARELYDAKGRNRYLFEPTIDSLSFLIKEIVENGIAPAKVAAAVKNTDILWLAELQKSHKPVAAISNSSYIPLITVGITHYERPDKIVDAVSSMIMQDYLNIELLVIDDGSHSMAANERLKYIENLLIRVGGRLIRQSNSYLGAARNRLIQEAKGEYIVFLDDDNYALPCMVRTLVKAALSTGADVITAQSIFMPLSQRSEFIARGANTNEPVSYVPTGGPLSIAGVSNVFGDASGIYRTSALKEVGGYTELRDVGHEDYELYIRLAQYGFSIMSCPIPIYLYEMGRESMLTKNNLVRDYQRVFKVIQQGGSLESLIDFAQIGIGTRVHELSWNRKHWEYSNHPLAEIMLPMLTNPNDKTDYLSKLIDIAQALGHTKFVAALLTCTRQQINVSSTQLQIAPIIQASVVEWATVDLKELTDASFEDDPTVFVQTLSKLCKRSLSMPAGAEHIICMWTRRMERERNFAVRFDGISALQLIDLLNQELENTGVKLGILRSIASAEIIAENFEVLWICTEQILKLETEIYLHTYHDLREAFETLPDMVFQHFISNGIRENRSGFKVALPLIQQALFSTDAISIPFKQKLLTRKVQAIWN